jgi:hypothetical protein
MVVALDVIATCERNAGNALHADARTEGARQEISKKNTVRRFESLEKYPDLKSTPIVYNVS